MINRSIWCPNVILLDPEPMDAYPTDQVIKIKNSFPDNLTFLFLAIGSYSHIVLDSQIILQQPEYSIYKEDIKERDSFTSELFKTGMPHVYYINTDPEFTKIAFVHFLDILGFDYPILCLASNLSPYLQPAVFVIPDNTHSKNLSMEHDSQASDCYTTKELVAKKITYSNKKITIV